MAATHLYSIRSSLFTLHFYIGTEQEVYMNWRRLLNELASLPDIGFITRNTGSLRNECPG